MEFKLICNMELANIIIQFIIYYKGGIIIKIEIEIVNLGMDQIDKKISKAVALVSKTEIYQRRLFIFLCILWTQIAMNALLNPMVFTNPLFKCAGKTSTEAYACLNMDKCVYENDFTASYYAGLYCQHRDARMTLQSIFAVGSIFGMLIIPMLSDLKGRWLASNLAILSVLLGNALIFFGIFIKAYLMIGAGQFLCAFGSTAMAGLSFSINSDFFSDDLRQKALIYYCAAWGLTDMSILLIWYFVPYWMFFTLFLLLIPITLLYLYFRSFFLESLHFLINSKQNYDEANRLLQQLAEVNNADQQDLNQSKSVLKQIQLIMISMNKEQTSAKENFRIILSKAQYKKAVVCLILLKMAYYSFYFGSQGCLERTGFNFGVSIFLLGLGEFTGYMTGTKIVPKFRRKKVLAITNLVTALVGILYMTKTVEQSPILASIILYLAFTMSSYNFSAITLIQTESFSSNIRATAVGSIFGISYLVRLGTPFAIGFLNQRGIHPIIASSLFILVLGIAPALIIDQTYGYTNLEEPLVDKNIQFPLRDFSQQQIQKLKN